MLMPRPGMWDCVRVGPSTSPIKLREGWLTFYYGVDSSDSYHVGAVLLDASEPRRVVARSGKPILSPTLPWERSGRRADTVFAGGAELVPGTDFIHLYYGAVDTYIGAVELRLSALLCNLQ